MDLKRIKQILKYGWMHAGKVSEIDKNAPARLVIFFDILKCYRKYRMWSNQYLSCEFWKLSAQEREEKGAKFREAGIARDEWQKDFQENRKFLLKYTARKWEVGLKREKRRAAYTKRYKAGKGLMVEYDVELSRQHYLPGTISIGNHVLLAKHVFIDYSGEVIIKDNVKITAGVVIESHHNDFEALGKGLDVNIPSKIVIEEGAIIGTHAIILDSCHYIGKNARIGGGAVVVKDVPDYATAVGVPAKVVKITPPENEV